MDLYKLYAAIIVECITDHGEYRSYLVSNRKKMNRQQQYLQHHLSMLRQGFCNAFLNSKAS
jgi:hypothetical protein